MSTTQHTGSQDSAHADAFDQAALNYPRDLRGYGSQPPRPHWPGGARLAISFVLNYEEGAEYTPLNGDAHAETYLHELPGNAPPSGLRNVNTESSYDFGARVGVWRLLNLFERASMPLTVFAVGKALELNPDAGRAFADLGHEVASHHWRWIDYTHMDPRLELEHIYRSIEAIDMYCGKPPTGWYGGRVSLQSRALAAETGVFRYDSDVYDDELPHWTRVANKDLLLIPYTLETNDVKFTVAPGFQTGNDFEAHLRDTFDTLYAEAGPTGLGPRMMNVGLHCRVSGRPGRAAALGRFLNYVQEFDDVWVARREEIAQHWTHEFPAGLHLKNNIT